MVYSLNNIYQQSKIDNPVKYTRVIGAIDKWKTHITLQTNTFKLSNDRMITIPKGFLWDRSSSPRIFWTILPPDGDFLVAALIHDWLYVNSDYVTENWFDGDCDAARAFADLEMLRWSEVMYGTKKISLHNIDNHTRYYGVKWFGKKKWLD